MIVLDETFGMKAYIDRLPSYRQKPAKKKTPTKLIPYSLQEEIAFFMNMEAPLILYFFDEGYTSGERLLRLQNWLLPNIKLYPIPLPPNRAQFVLEADLLETRLKNEETLRYAEIRNQVKWLRNQSEQWIIAPMMTPFYRHHNKIKHYQIQADADYFLFQHSGEKKKKPQAKGSPSVLLQDIVEKKREKTHLIAVRKGLAVDLPGVQRENIYDIHNEAIPVHLPYIHIISLTNPNAMME